MKILFIQQTYWKIMGQKLFDPLFGCIMIMIEEQKHIFGTLTCKRGKNISIIQKKIIARAYKCNDGKIVTLN